MEESNPLDPLKTSTRCLFTIVSCYVPSDATYLIFMVIRLQV